MEARFLDMKGRGVRIVVFWVVVILVVALDQATKAGVRAILDDGPQVLIPGIMNLVHVQNTGAAFSIGQGGGLFFVIVAVAFLVGAIYLVWTAADMPLWLAMSIGLVAGGGVGNMIDRVIDGAVTDFLATTFIDFPVFNVADICVTVGIALSVIGYWRWDSSRERDVAERAETLRQDDGFGNA